MFKNIKRNLNKFLILSGLFATLNMAPVKAMPKNNFNNIKKTEKAIKILENSKFEKIPENLNKLYSNNNFNNIKKAEKAIKILKNNKFEKMPENLKLNKKQDNYSKYKNIVIVNDKNRDIHNENNAHNDVNKIKQLLQKGIEKSSTQFIENSNKLEEIKQLLIRLDNLKEHFDYKPNAEEILSSVVEPYLTYRENECFKRKTNLEDMAKCNEEIYKVNPNYKSHIEEYCNSYIFLLEKESKILKDIACKLQEKIEDTINYNTYFKTHLIVSYDQEKEKWNEIYIESKPIIRHNTKDLVEFIIDSFTKLKNQLRKL